MNRATNPYAGYRYPAEIISHAVWLYFRFTLSFRDIEEMLAARGIFVTYETIRQWCLKFGQPFANKVRRRLPRPGDKWHLDEMYLRAYTKTYPANTGLISTRGASETHKFEDALTDKSSLIRYLVIVQALKINGQRHDLWRAVDQDGQVLDILLQTRRDKHAAKRFFRCTGRPCAGLRYLAAGNMRPKGGLTSSNTSYHG